MKLNLQNWDLNKCGKIPQKVNQSHQQINFSQVINTSFVNVNSVPQVQSKAHTQLTVSPAPIKMEYAQSVVPKQLIFLSIDNVIFDSIDRKTTKTTSEEGFNKERTRSTSISFIY